MSMKEALAEQGLGVEDQYGVVVGSEQNRYDEYLRLNWQTAANVWLVFSILKEVIVDWPKIRQFLKNAGLTDDEVITLGLSTFISKPLKKTRKKKTRKKKT